MTTGAQTNLLSRHPRRLVSCSSQDALPAWAVLARRDWWTLEVLYWWLNATHVAAVKSGLFKRSDAQNAYIHTFHARPVWHQGPDVLPKEGPTQMLAFALRCHFCGRLLAARFLCSDALPLNGPGAWGCVAASLGRKVGREPRVRKRISEGPSNRLCILRCNTILGALLHECPGERFFSGNLLGKMKPVLPLITPDGPPMVSAGTRTTKQESSWQPVHVHRGCPHSPLLEG